MVHHCLREPSSDDNVGRIYVFVNEFLRTISNGAKSDEDKSLGIERFEQWAYGALQIPEKDTLWHTQMAMVYVGSNFTRDAIERSQLALKMDPSNLESIHLLCKTCSTQGIADGDQSSKKDMGWMQDPSHVKDLGDLSYELAEKYWKDEQFDLAIPIYAASLKQAPQDEYRFLWLFMQYLERGRETEIISLIEEISAIEGETRLAEVVMKSWNMDFIEDLDAVIRNAAIRTKQFSVLDTLYESAIRIGEKTNDQEVLCRVRCFYGEGLYEHNKREEKAIELWETSLPNYLVSSDAVYGLRLLNKLIAKLAPLYLQQALVSKTKSDSNTVAKYLSRLSGMLPEGVAASQLDFPPQLWLARYYHLNGDDAKARQMVRNSLRVVIELLSDDEDSNDKDAFRKAHSVFVSLGDDKNALTALAMETHESRFSKNTDNGRNTSSLCTGGCGRTWDLPREIWICKHCVNVRLDDDCMKALKDGKLEKNICNSDHDLIRV